MTSQSQSNHVHKMNNVIIRDDIPVDAETLKKEWNIVKQIKPVKSHINKPPFIVGVFRMPPGDPPVVPKKKKTPRRNISRPVTKPAEKYAVPTLSSSKITEPQGSKVSIDTSLGTLPSNMSDVGTLGSSTFKIQSNDDDHLGSTTTYFEAVSDIAKDEIVFESIISSARIDFKSSSCMRPTLSSSKITEPQGSKVSIDTSLGTLPSNMSDVGTLGSSTFKTQSDDDDHLGSTTTYFDAVSDIAKDEIVFESIISSARIDFKSSCMRLSVEKQLENLARSPVYVHSEE